MWLPYTLKKKKKDLSIHLYTRRTVLLISNIIYISVGLQPSLKSKTQRRSRRRSENSFRFNQQRSNVPQRHAAVQSRGSCLIRIGVLPMDWLCRRSRHRTYSLNWDESTPPPQDALMLKPFWKRRSRTCRRQSHKRCEVKHHMSQLQPQWLKQVINNLFFSSAHVPSANIEGAGLMARETGLTCTELSLQ